MMKKMKQDIVDVFHVLSLAAESMVAALVAPLRVRILKRKIRKLTGGKEMLALMKKSGGRIRFKNDYLLDDTEGAVSKNPKDFNVYLSPSLPGSPLAALSHELVHIAQKKNDIESFYMSAYWAPEYALAFDRLIEASAFAQSEKMMAEYAEKTGNLRPFFSSASGVTRDPAAAREGLRARFNVYAAMLLKDGCYDKDVITELHARYNEIEGARKKGALSPALLDEKDSADAFARAARRIDPHGMFYDVAKLDQQNVFGVNEELSDSYGLIKKKYKALRKNELS